MRKRKAFKDVRIRILLATIIIACIGVIVFVRASFHYYQKNNIAIAAKLVNGNLVQAGNQIENVYMDLLKLSRIVSEDEIIHESLRESTPSIFPRDYIPKDFSEFSKDDYYRYSRIYEKLRYYQNNFLFNYDSHISFLAADGMVCNLTEAEAGEDDEAINEYLRGISGQKWFADFYESQDMLTWVVPFEYENIPGNHKTYITLAYKLFNGNGTCGAVMLIHVDLEILDLIFEDDIITDVFLFNEDDRMIYAKTKEIVPVESDISYTEFINQASESYLIFPYRFEHFGLKMATVMKSYDNLLVEMQSFQKTYIVLSMVIFGFMILCIFLVMDYLMKPLRFLVDRLKSGEFDVFRLEQDAKTDEIGSIVETFENMFRHIDELHKQIMDEQKLKYQLKYNALKAQINPHFLFNTLNIIKWKAVMDGNKEVSEMLADLGYLLEASMGRNSEYITIKEELSLLQCYMRIQNRRFDKAYILNIDCPEDVSDYKILKMVLQPVVENSIVHGFREASGEGIVSVRIERKEEDLFITVTDNGVGMTEEKIKEILSIEANNSGKTFNGIGIANINQRIKILYGREYGITISSDTEGTRVCYHIPIN